MLIGYMRVSSDSDRQSTNLQRDALLAAGVDERHLFEDKASGAKTGRPGLTRCLDFLKPGDTLTVWKLDRLGRSLQHLLQVVSDLKEKEVGFRSLTEGMDTTTAQGELFFHIFGALAQFERTLIQERIKAGLASAELRGRRGGRPLAINPDKLETILAALEAGTTPAAACRAFEVSPSTLHATLARVGWSAPADPAANDVQPLATKKRGKAR